MSAHHVVAVDAVRGVLHAVVDFSPEHRQVLSEPADTEFFPVMEGGGGIQPPEATFSHCGNLDGLNRISTVPPPCLCR